MTSAARSRVSEHSLGFSEDYDQIPLMDSENVESPFHAPPTPLKLLLVGIFAAVGLAVVVVVSIGGQDTQPKVTLSIPHDGVVELVATHNPTMDALNKAMKHWATGQYHGDKCLGTAQQDVLPDATMSSNVAIEKIGMQHQWVGPAGLCTWSTAWESLDAISFSSHNFPISGGRIIQANTWTPAAMNGAKADHSVTDISVVQQAEGKISSFDYHWSEPTTMQRLFDKKFPAHVPQNPTGDLKVFQDTFKAWGQGMFHGAMCQGNAANTVSESVEVRNTGYALKKYNGLDGWCEWCKWLEKYNFSDISPHFFDIGGGEIIMTTTYTPTLMNGIRGDHKVVDVCFVTVRNNKVVSFDLNFGEPEALIDLDQQMATHSLFTAVKDWHHGAFAGDKCVANAAKDFTGDCKVTNTPAMPKAGFAHSYPGRAGFCAWVKNLGKLDLSTLKMGAFPFGDNSRLIHTLTYTPALVNGAQVHHKVTDVSIVHTKHGKMAGFDFFWSEPRTIEGLFDDTVKEPVPPKPTGDLAVWINVFQKWGKGLFRRDLCHASAAPLVSDQVVVRAHGFAAVFKGQGFSQAYKGTGFRPVYSGIDGWCEWCTFLERYNFSDYMPHFYTLGNGEIIMQATHTPKLLNGIKAAHPVADAAYIKIANSKVASMDYYNGDAFATTDLEAQNALAVMQQAMKHWGDGLYNGASCQETAAQDFTTDLHITSTPALDKAEIVSEYKGANGICAWTKALTKFEMKTSKWGFYPLVDGRVIQTNTWTPTLSTGAAAKHKVTDVSIAHVRGNKMTGFDYHWAEPATIDALFDPSMPKPAPEKATADLAAWKGVFDAWVKGLFEGDACHENAPQFVAESVAVRNHGFDKDYDGIDGWCQWGVSLDAWNFTDLKPAFFSIGNGEIVQTNTHMPALKNGAKADHQVVDVAFITMKFGKIMRMDYFYAEPGTNKRLCGDSCATAAKQQ